jgi:hypothetical protein
MCKMSDTSSSSGSEPFSLPFLRRPDGTFIAQSTVRYFKHRVRSVLHPKGRSLRHCVPPKYWQSNLQRLRIGLSVNDFADYVADVLLSKSGRYKLTPADLKQIRRNFQRSALVSEASLTFPDNVNAPTSHAVSLFNSFCIGY